VAANAVGVNFARRRVVVLGWVSRIISMLVSLAMVRVSFQLLGEGQYAVLQILVAALAWLTLSSFGLGPALKNLVAGYGARGELDVHLRSTSASLIGIMFVLGVLAVVVTAPFASNWLLRRLTHDQIWATRALLAGGVLALIAAMGQVSMEVLYAEFRAHWGYTLLIGSSMLTLSFIVALTKVPIAPSEMIFWVACATLAPQAVIGVIALRMTGLLPLRVRLPEAQALRRITGLSFRFWLYALLSNLILLVDSIVISQILVAREIVLYSIMIKIAAVGLGLFTTMISVVWPEWTHFWELRQWAVLRKRVLFLGLLGPVICVPGAVLAVLILPGVIRIWLSDAKVAPPMLLVVEFIAYLAVRFWTDVHSVALMSGNRVFAATKYLAIQALITAPLEYIFGKNWGAEGVIFGLIVGFLLTSAWMFPYRFYSEIRALSRAEGADLQPALETA
jgi:O-antigen/teichoic acid export membrane protein